MDNVYYVSIGFEIPTILVKNNEADDKLSGKDKINGKS